MSKLQQLIVTRFSQCGSKQLQIQKLTKSAMRRGLRKFRAGFPRSCCLTISYSKLKYIAYINWQIVFLKKRIETSIHLNKTSCASFKIQIQLKSNYIKIVNLQKNRSMKAFYGLEKGCKARRDDTGLTVRNVRIAASRLCQKPGKSFLLSRQYNRNRLCMLSQFFIVNHIRPRLAMLRRWV